MLLLVVALGSSIPAAVAVGVLFRKKPGADRDANGSKGRVACAAVVYGVSFTINLVLIVGSLSLTGTAHTAVASVVAGFAAYLAGRWFHFGWSQSPSA
jgi:hypothetical protein